MKGKFEIYHAAQNWFARNKDIYQVSRFKALEILTHKSLEVTKVDRVGIWFYNSEKDSLCEEITFIRNKIPSQGAIIRKSDFPDFFRFLDHERVLACSDITKEFRISEFIQHFIKPLEVFSFLYAPIFSDGEIIGSVCFEQKNKPKDWDVLDKDFAVSFSDLVGRLIESEKRHTYEIELRHRINYLENDLNKKLYDLNEAKLSLDMALEGAQVGKWDWNILTDKVSLNKTWYTKLGYEYDELPQCFETFRKVLHPDDEMRVLDELDHHIKGRTFFYESRYRMITKSGDIQWCLDRGCVIERTQDGSPVRVIGVNVNVTPIVKWEESLIISEQQLKAMIQSLPIPVAMFDRSFKYLAMSSRWMEEWREYVPFKEDESITNYFRQDWIIYMEKALNGKRLLKEEELVNFGDGIQIWLRWAMQPWRNAKNEIAGIIVMAENITSKKDAEVRLAQASKLTALGEMAGGIAHEINNPLSIIKGYIDLLRRHSIRKTLAPELLTEYIERIDKTVSRISRIVNGMRRFARESSLDKKVNYSMNKIIEETLDVCLEKINNNGTRLDVEYLQNDTNIFCRPVEISQVLLNLINNSFQATSNFSHPWIKITAENLNDIVRINIIDCGKIIPLAVQQKLFQPFFTTKDVGVGTGLGLSISRGIIEEHKGKLFYKVGAPSTTFVIEIPQQPS
jgi:signal transduction histidine kinase/predicted CopG family antitoxin